MSVPGEDPAPGTSVKRPALQIRIVHTMPDLIPDPELEELINEVNVSKGETAAVERQKEAGKLPLPSPLSSLTLESSDRLTRFLREMVRLKASDLLLLPGSLPVVRVNGRLQALSTDELSPNEVESLLAPQLSPLIRRQLEEQGTSDFSIRLSAGENAETHWRLRLNLQISRGKLVAGIRLLPNRIPGLAELNLPPTLTRLVDRDRGLVLISGPTGSGKSTTLATLVDYLNRHRGRHIISIEDPVEYEHRSRKSLVEQIEVGTDTPSFSVALRAALRRDPDVILVGEMRDLETISTVLTAAETGHLILSTLHTADATRAVHRIIDIFPAAQQDQVRHQLALGLGAIVCQQLLPTADGSGRVPALEILEASYPVRNLIRKQQTHLLYNEMMSGGGEMIQMEESLAALVRKGLVTEEEAAGRANRFDEIRRRLMSPVQV